MMSPVLKTFKRIRLFIVGVIIFEKNVLCWEPIPLFLKQLAGQWRTLTIDVTAATFLPEIEIIRALLQIQFLSIFYSRK